MRKIAAVLLATDPEALRVTGGERLVDRAVHALREGGCGPILVVTGEVTVEVLGALVVPDPLWRDGHAASVRAGLAALNPQVRAVLVARVDAPGLTAASVARAIEAGPRPGADLTLPGDPVYAEVGSAVIGNAD